MSILSIETGREAFYQKLKQAKFRLSNQWGAPSSWGETTMFYEKLLHLVSPRGQVAVSVIYFTPEFKGYVTAFVRQNLSPANRMLFIGNLPYGTGAEFDEVCPIEVEDMVDVEAIIEAYLKRTKSKILGVNNSYE